MRIIVDGVEQDAPPNFTLPVIEPAGQSRIINGSDFLALWLPGEVAASIVDPELLVGAFTALAQNNVNLDSPKTALLLARAVSKGFLTQARADRIKAGQAPA